jgi:L-threonylcarbamoyladenylate synthase
VRDEFEDAIWVLDGDVSDVGIESTIVDLTRGVPAILRLGAVTADDVVRVTGVMPQSNQVSQADAPRVSGTLLAHYAPRTPLRWANDEAVSRDSAVCLYFSSEFDVTPFKNHIRLPNEATGFAQGLYHALRELDVMNATYIVVENLPVDTSWDAVRDRLKRAVVGSNEERKL